VLVDGDLVLTESVAIVVYLAEKYSHKGLLPASKSVRRSTAGYCSQATELEQPLWRISRHTARYPEKQRLPGDVILAGREFKEHMQAAVRRGR
jgi:glutathione S-transferase